MDEMQRRLHVLQELGLARATLPDRPPPGGVPGGWRPMTTKDGTFWLVSGIGMGLLAGDNFDDQAARHRSRTLIRLSWTTHPGTSDRLTSEMTRARVGWIVALPGAPGASTALAPAASVDDKRASIAERVGHPGSVITTTWAGHRRESRHRSCVVSNTAKRHEIITCSNLCGTFRPSLARQARVPTGERGPTTLLRGPTGSDSSV